MIYLANQCFSYIDRVLHIEGVNALNIVKSFGTPTYCYSQQAIKNNFQEFVKNLPRNTLICYALKANSNLAIVNLLANLGAGAEVVSEGEIRRAILAGVPVNKIVFSGVGKTRNELIFALNKKIYQFNVESIEELRLLDQLAISKGIKANVSIRINPNINAKTHDKITTGLKINKFGIPEEDIKNIFNSRFSGVNIVGISVHIGSQISNLEIFASMVSRVKAIASNLKNHGYNILRIDVGGGLGVSYKEDDNFPTISQYSQMLKESFHDTNYQLICEPGRCLVANSGILLTKVLYCKSNDEVKHVIVDAGMNDLMRPALYNSKHMIIPVVKSNDDDKRVVDIVGPVCESDDIFAHKYEIQKLNSEDVIAICTTGAYGASMSSRYNSRYLISEVLVNDDKFSEIRCRETYDEMFKCESIPKW